MQERPSIVSLIVPAFSFVGLGIAIMSFICAALALREASTRPSPPDAEAKIAALRSDLAKQRAEIEKQRAELANQRTITDAQIKKAQGLIWQTLGDPNLFAQLSRRRPYAVIDPTSKKFDRAETPSGFVLVSCQDVQPIADGCKVSLSINNPLSVPLIGFKIAVRWGPRYVGNVNDVAAFSRWAASLKKKEVAFAQTLEPGRWNGVHVVLEQILPQQLGYLEVGVTPEMVSGAQLAARVEEIDQNAQPPGLEAMARAEEIARSVERRGRHHVAGNIRFEAAKKAAEFDFDWAVERCRRAGTDGSREPPPSRAFLKRADEIATHFQRVASGSDMFAAAGASDLRNEAAAYAVDLDIRWTAELAKLRRQR